MNFSPVKQGRGRLRKTIEQITKRGHMMNSMLENLVFKQTQWHNIIHVTDSRKKIRLLLLLGLQTSFATNGLS